MDSVLVNKIIPFSSVDGPGNRMAIFLQGCNFDCLYCHNPETINMCTGCGKCVSSCKNNALKYIDSKIVWDKTKCTQCGMCLKTCKINSDPRARMMSPNDVAREVEKVKNFISGVTVSGGECTLRIDYILELGKLIKEMGLTFFVDTNGSFPFWEVNKLNDYVDSVMLDVKAFNRDEHIMLTGKDNDVVIKNLKYLRDKKMLYEVRTVVVPQVLNNEHTVDEVSKIISSDQTIRYKLIKYRQLGVREEKLQSFTPSMEYMHELKNIAVSNGCKNIIIT